jgi:hypothetical protein
MQQVIYIDVDPPHSHQQYSDSEDLEEDVDIVNVSVCVDKRGIGPQRLGASLRLVVLAICVAGR